MSISPTREQLQAAIESDTLSPALIQQALGLLDSTELAELLTWLSERHAGAATEVAQAQTRTNLLQIVAFLETRALQRPPVSDPLLTDAVLDYYRKLPADSPARGDLLRLLAAPGTAAELALLAEVMACEPPSSAEACALALSPLFRRHKFDPQPLFPNLLDSLLHGQVAPAALDLMNFLTREKFFDSHPAAQRSGQLGMLLGEVAGRLTSIEERREVPDAQTQQQVREGVSLLVALCDALALIGDREQVGKLRQALGVTHRRIHTEAAYALAKLGEAEGQQLLLSLAAEPSARLRVLAYADELGMLEEIDEEHRTPRAQAEAQLAVWLAEPMQMGMPPHVLELVEQQEMYWPGYDDLVPCFLFRFGYDFPGGQMSNIGIAGPLTMAFSADLESLPTESIYAAFAGWQAEHVDIRETPIESLDDVEARDAQQKQARLLAQEFSDIRPISLGQFFEENVLIAEARREGVGGIALVDGTEIDWWPTEGKPRALGSREIYAIYKGKRLLEAFNAG